jgi:hypothetical protein
LTRFERRPLPLQLKHGVGSGADREEEGAVEVAWGLPSLQTSSCAVPSIARLPLIRLGSSQLTILLMKNFLTVGVLVCGTDHFFDAKFIL